MHIALLDHLLIKKTGGSRCIYQSELAKACFQNDAANSDFKYLPRRSASDKVLHDETFSPIGEGWRG